MTSERQRRRSQFTVLARIAAGLLLLGTISEPCSAAGPNLEYSVKAAFLLNFTKFVEWPPSAFAEPQSPLAICLLGNDPFGRVLDDVVQNETINGRPLTIRRIGQPPAPQLCHVLFIDPALKEPAKLLGSLPPGVLTVGEGDRFLRDGGMIAFVIDNRRVRFDINQAATESNELKLSSKLLSVARSVTTR